METIKIKPQKATVAEPWLIEGPGIEVFAPGEDPVEKLLNDYTLQLGDRPYVRSVRKLYELYQKQLPPEIAALRGETYLVTHAVGLIAKTGANRIDTVGYMASFEDHGSTIELFPNTRFKEYFSISAKFEAGVSADGYAKLPDQVGDLAKDIINLGAGAELQLSTEAQMVGKLALTIKSPKVQALGNASSTIIWQFNQDDKPLVGDQVMVQTIVVPKGQEKITLKMQAFAMIDPGIFRRPVKIETDTIIAEVELE
jgi:hypothetical protein